ncbi:RDD family protein [Salinimonas sp. HHU 13199]|uniref:RDD family protein n=1 Tax=Salinimonas profundi TaxID=2729140 RepID=A0ABR8LJ03_9ALTE|nr:RDD family protein [Salinimonas profundi]MBD3584292.1 RDD family protein [Salinimonas profundi]
MDRHDTQLSSHGQIMTDKQIRDVVTPYEFGVSEMIIGTPLARPFRRGLALLIDLILVVMLTHLPSIILASVGVIFFWRAGKKKNTPARFIWLRRILKGISAILLFGILIAVFDNANEPDDAQFANRNSGENILKGIQLIEIGSAVMKMSSDIAKLETAIQQSRCSAMDCWEDYLSELSDDIGHIPIPPNVLEELTSKLAPAMTRTLDDTQQQALLQTFTGSLNVISEKRAGEKDAQELPVPSSEPSTDNSATFNVTPLAIPVHESGTPSLLAWVQGVLEDLGIGFGWAALYFTAVTVWMNGQTPGKWMLRLKVIKLDGTPMTLWQSFGRYGGYGAGLATGLLGFMQIFWEPNRQAIQDKISETLVIQLGVPKLDVQAIRRYRDKDAETNDEHLI